MFFNDLEMSTKILASKSALESKNMSRSIKGYEDSKWGTGVPLHKAGCLDSTLWSGNGILGEILCEIHQEYFQQNPNVTGSLSGVTETIAVVATEEEMS